MDKTFPAGSPAPRRVAVPALALAAVLAACSGAALATPSGVTSETLALGGMEHAVPLKFKWENWGFGDGFAITSIRTVRFKVAPGGYFGWHRHGGPVWVAIANPPAGGASGLLTLYDRDDASCQGKVYGPGAGFLDPGSHVHNARNESASDVWVVATFLLPDGGAVREDLTEEDYLKLGPDYCKDRFHDF